MARKDPFHIKLHNPNPHADPDNGQSEDIGVIFLLTARDDAKNTLELTITNTAGAGVPVAQKTPFYLDMAGAFIPPHVIEALEVTCPGGWQSQVFKNKGMSVGLILSPAAPTTLADQATLKFQLKNIVFSKDDIAKANHKVKFFSASCSAFDPYHKRYEASGPVQLKPWSDQPSSLTQVQLAFVPVPKDQAWNVKMDEQEFWFEEKDKGMSTVFSNSLKTHQIQTRLAFRLTNLDHHNGLKLTADSFFQVSFVPGQGFSQLADPEELFTMKIIDLTGNWKVEQAAGEASPEWILRPLHEITLAQRGGNCTFLIDAVLANTNPSDNKGSPSLTQMYVSYDHIPRRAGDGNYDPGCLAATIEKRAPEPQVLSFDFEPKQEIYDPFTKFSLAWSVFGVETLRLSHINAKGKLQPEPVPAKGRLELVLPPSDDGIDRYYQLMNGNELLRETHVKTKRMAEFLPSVTLVQSVHFTGKPVSGDPKPTPVCTSYTLNPQADGTVSASIDFTTQEHPQEKLTISTVPIPLGRSTWTVSPVQGGYQLALVICIPPQTHWHMDDIGQKMLVKVTFVDFKEFRLKCSVSSTTGSDFSLALETQSFLGAFAFSYFAGDKENQPMGELMISATGAEWKYKPK